MEGIERDREQRSLLPFEHVLLGLAFLPHFGGAAALDHQANLLIEMAIDIERAGARYLDHVLAPQPFGAKQLDVGAAPAEPLPRLHRQVLHALDPDAAID